MPQLKLKSPAKVNLFFRILSKRCDGYHEIATHMHAIDLYDRVEITPSTRFSLSCSNPLIPQDESNLAAKAHALFCVRLGEQFPVSIHIDKHIPAGAGLGGGSSNAATVLWGLNQLCKEPFSIGQLMGMGAILGSDVPFFFSSGNAYCTGRGEVVHKAPVCHLESIDLHLPGLFVLTSKVFQEVIIDEVDGRDPLELLKCGDWVNDLEQPASRVEPRLIDVKNRLRETHERVAMSGSGSAFFTSGKGYKLITRHISDWYRL